MGGSGGSGGSGGVWWNHWGVGGSTPGPFCGFNFFMKVVLLIDRGIIEGENHLPHCQLLWKVKEVTDALDLEELVDSWRIGITARENALAGISRKKIGFGQASLELEPSS